MEWFTALGLLVIALTLAIFLPRTSTVVATIYVIASQKILMIAHDEIHHAGAALLTVLAVAFLLVLAIDLFAIKEKQIFPK